MPASTSLSAVPALESKSYREDKNFKAEGKPEPNIRSQTVVYHIDDKQWWITVTFLGKFSFYDRTYRARKNQTKTRTTN